MTMVPPPDRRDPPTRHTAADAASLGAPDLGALLSQVGQMRQHLAVAQRQAADAVVQGSAGGGAVTVTVTGGLEFQSVRIDPSVVDPAEADLLCDLVLAALRDAVDKAQRLQADVIGGSGIGDVVGGLQGLLGP